MCDVWLFNVYSYNKKWLTFCLVVCTTFMQPDKIVLKLLCLSRRKKAQVLWFGIYVTHSLQVEKVIKLISAGLICCPDWWFIVNQKYVLLWHSNKTVLNNKFMRDWIRWPVISYSVLEYCHVIWKWLKRSVCCT